MTQNITFLDLDALKPEVEVVVKLHGQEHKLEPVKLEDFVFNIELVQKLGMSGNVQEEIDTMQKILLRAFPTMTKADLGKLRLDQLKALNDFAQSHSGQTEGEKKVVEEAKEKGVENPQ